MSGLRRLPGSLVALVVVGAGLVLTLFPILWVAMVSLKTKRDAFAMPPAWLFDPIFDHYLKLWANEGFRAAFLNSAAITAIGVSLAILIAIPAAYALQRTKVRGARLIALWLLLAYMLPEFLFVIPMYVLYQRIGLYDTHLGLALVYQVHVLPFAVWMLKSFFAEVPKELEESARIDGCRTLAVLRHVYVPISLPGIAATAILSAIWIWNELAIALGLTFTKAETITVAVTRFRGYTSIDWGAMTAASIVAIVPMLLFAALAQRSLVKGITLGAVKG